MKKTEGKLYCYLFSFKSIYWLLFAFFTSFFLAYKIKSLLIDWKSINLDLLFLLPLSFITILYGSFTAAANNFIEKLLAGISRKLTESKVVKNVYFYLIILSFLSYFLLHRVLILLDLHTKPHLLGNITGILVDIGFSFVLFMLLLFVTSIFATVRRNIDLKKPSISGILIFVSIIIVSNTIAVYYISSSKFVYYWDNVGYWIISHNMSDMLFSNIIEFIKSIYDSILTKDYNYLSVVPIAFLTKFFGKSRLAFILIILNIYYIPSIWFLRKMIIDMIDGINKAAHKNLTYCITLLFFPIILFVSLVGGVDIGGLILIPIIILLYFKKDMHHVHKNIIIGLFLVLLYLFRRWYMFWILSFIICTILHAAIIAIADSQKNRFFVAVKNIGISLIIPATFGGILTLFFQQLVVKKLLLSNYSDMYSAYNFGLSRDFKQIFSYIGTAVLIMTIISLIFSIYNKQLRSRAIFLASQVILCFFIFTRVQTHEVHHYLMYIPGIMALVAYFIVNISSIKKKALTWSLISIIGIIGLFNFTLTFFDTSKIKNSIAKDVFRNNFFASLKIIPERRSDIKEVERLVKTLDSLAQSSNAKIGTLVASFTINYDVLNNYEMSIGVPEKQWKQRSYLATDSTVDRRSKTPFWLSDCDYIIAGNPPQTHLRRDEQKVIAIPTNLLAKGIGFGKAFKRMYYSFKLQFNNTIYIYKRIRKVSKQEEQQLADQFHNFYPDLPEQYPPKAPSIK
jgi:hypothetical protein